MDSRAVEAWAAALTLLHRYLFRDVLVATTVAVAGFAFVLFGGNVLKDAARIALGQLTIGQLGELLSAVLLGVLPYALPFGLLTAVLLVLGRLSAQHEITAMRSAGLSLAQIGASVMFIGLLGVAGSLAINHVYAPRAKTYYRKMLFDIAQQNPLQLIVPGTFVRDFPQAVVFVRGRDGENLRDIWAWKMDDAHRVREWTWLESARLRIDEETNELVLTGIGKMQVDVRSDKDPEDFSRVMGLPTYDANGREIRIPLGDVFKRRVFEQKPSWMDFGELMQERDRLAGSDNPRDQRRLQEVKMTVHERSSMAFSALSFAFIAIPLGIQTRRKETSANLGLALALILLFYAGIISVGWLDRRPELHPEVLLWVPNLSFQILGGWMWWRFGRN